MFYTERDLNILISSIALDIKAINGANEILSRKLNDTLKLNKIIIIDEYSTTWCMICVTDPQERATWSQWPGVPFANFNPSMDK